HHAQVVRAVVSAAVDDASPHHPDAEPAVPGGAAVPDRDPRAHGPEPVAEIRVGLHAREERVRDARHDAVLVVPTRRRPNDLMQAAEQPEPHASVGDRLVAETAADVRPHARELEAVPPVRGRPVAVERAVRAAEREPVPRSEERRVGKERRPPWPPPQYKNKFAPTTSL